MCLKGSMTTIHQERTKSSSSSTPSSSSIPPPKNILLHPCPKINAWINVIYQPLHFPNQIHEIPHKYGKKIPNFDNKGKHIAKEHVVKF